jgi:hypothetical protein
MARFRAVKTPILLAAVLGLAFGACVSQEERHEPSVKTPPVLAGVPLPIGSRILDTTSTGEAARAVLAVAGPPETVVAFYRRELPKAGFRIVGDVGDSDQTNLYAQRSGPPLWVQVRRGPQPGTTTLTVIGAVGGPARRGDSAVGDTAKR